MKIENKVVLTAIDSVNKNNEAEPTRYIIEKIDPITEQVKLQIIKSTDFAYALQYFVNRFKQIGL
jgi:hypothetical protein